MGRSGRLRDWTTGSVRQEGFCRHQLIADLILVCERLGHAWIGMRSDYFDLEGVDVVLTKGRSSIPLQLKSMTDGAKTAKWSVQRRLCFPRTEQLREALHLNPGPDTEGLGGALVIQRIVWLQQWPHVRVWYQAVDMSMIFCRDPKRFRSIVAECHACPRRIAFTVSDLTPPMSAEELAWLLVGSLKIDSPLVSGDTIHHESALLTGTREGPNLARKAFAEFEMAAKARWRAWLKDQVATAF